MKSLIELEQGGADGQYSLTVEPRLCVGTPNHLFLYGGAGLASAIAAMERASARPLLWASAQYLSYARPPATLLFDVQSLKVGRNSSQCRVAVSSQGADVIHAHGTFGSQDPAIPPHQWAAMPDAPAPATCEPMSFAWNRRQDDLYGQFDLRVAKGRYGSARADVSLSDDGHTQIWARSMAPVRTDATLLAVLADFIPSAVASSVGQSAVASSLDNSLRVAALVPSEWILCDIKTSAVSGGYGQAHAALFAEDGTLLATSSQTVIVRPGQARPAAQGDG